MAAGAAVILGFRPRTHPLLLLAAGAALFVAYHLAAG
jgi:hypothetical protein